MGNTKRYWSGLEELNKTEDFKEVLENEFPETQSVDEFLSEDKISEANSGRRDFLKFMGFSVTAATLAACETPVVKSIPYVIKPEEITPGVANYYASTYYDGNNYANVLVKSREGRPIFIKPNRKAGSNGEINAQVNASVLGLYDAARLKEPMNGTASISWSDLDSKVTAALSSASNPVVLTNTVVSPTKQRAINELKAKYGANHVQFDSVSYSGIRTANNASFGKNVIPTYAFNKAKVVVSFNADFLGTWLNSSAYSIDFAQTRKPEGKWMSKHFQLESNMSLSGTNADVRMAVRPSELRELVAGLYGSLSGSGAKMALAGKETAIQKLVEALKANRGESIVIAGSNDPNVQMVVNSINELLGNYGKTIDLNEGLNMFQGDEADMSKLVADMKAGRVDFLAVDSCNPAFNWINGSDFVEGLKKVKTSVATSLFADETASNCTYIAPDHHQLESWGDMELTKGRIDLVQPSIRNLFDSRSAGESFLVWSGNATDYYTYLRQTYNPGYSTAGMYTGNVWNEAVHNGYM
ncbi:MAG: TAT-variant-translocated molybdopterin oxidoreductase, partial [Flavobacteriales bacterium]